MTYAFVRMLAGGHRVRSLHAARLDRFHEAISAKIPFEQPNVMIPFAASNAASIRHSGPRVTSPSLPKPGLELTNTSTGVGLQKRGSS